MELATLLPTHRDVYDGILRLLCRHLVPVALVVAAVLLEGAAQDSAAVLAQESVRYKGRANEILAKWSGHLDMEGDAESDDPCQRFSTYRSRCLKLGR